MRLNKNLVVLTGICLGIAIIAMIFSAINTALAAIKIEFSASVTQLQWIINIFGVAMCSTLVIFSRIADIYGRKRLYLIGIAGTGISMLGAGLAPSIHWILFFQCTLGLSAAILLPVSQALISHVFPAEERSRAIGIWAAVVGLALAAGPILSGFIVSVLSWRWVFLVNLPFIISSLILVALFAPESRNNESSKTIDTLGSILLAITIGCFVLALTEVHTLKAWTIGILYTASIIALIALLITEKKSPEPIIREDLFTNRMFLTASFANFFIIFFVWVSFFLMPLYLQTEHYYTALAAGCVMLFVTVPLSIFSFIGGGLYKTYGPKPLILLGFLFLTISASMQLYFTPDTKFLIIGLSALFFGIGWGLAWGPTTTAAITTLSHEHAGIASGSFITIQETGGNLGLAITMAVVNMHSDFMRGYSSGMWVLLSVSVAGFLLTLSMEPGQK